MPEATAPLLLLGAGALALVGLAWLALAMDTHWEQVFAQAGPTPATQRRQRLLAALLLAASLALCLRVDHPSMAILVWIMLLAASAVLTAMALAWRPHWLRWVWPRWGNAAG